MGIIEVSFWVCSRLAGKGTFALARSRENHTEPNYIRKRYSLVTLSRDEATMLGVRSPYGLPRAAKPVLSPSSALPGEEVEARRFQGIRHFIDAHPHSHHSRVEMDSQT